MLAAGHSAHAESGLRDIISKGREGQALNFDYRIEKVFPHDPEASTQGLFFDRGFLYEGTGRKKKSWLYRSILETGESVQEKKLPEDIYGEGIALHGEYIVQLTWQSHKGFVYERESFRLEREFSYKTEGWGITSDGDHLIMSDGSSTLIFFDPATYNIIRKISVTDGKEPIKNLNELEYIHGAIWANVWESDRIAIINPDSGQVIGWVNLSGLLESQNTERDSDQVANGIAYDKEFDRLFVTGKLWPYLFQIQLVQTEERSSKKPNTE